MGFFRLFIPLSIESNNLISQASKILTEKQTSKLKKFLKLGKVSVEIVQPPVSKLFVSEYQYPMLVTKSSDPEVSKFIQMINPKIEKDSKKVIFEKYDPEKIVKMVSPHIVGFDEIKKAAAYQLFSKEKFHILLLGDPGTGKTEILRAIQELAPKSSFGLGSGTTGVGLTVNISGKEVNKGLLPQADEGICCIDELNLLKKEDFGSLYNAMEKGFVTYDKKGIHKKFDARVRILATANPKGDAFSTDVNKIKSQLPFDQALLTRFHLIFFIKKPSKEQFMKITKKMLSREPQKVNKSDLEFVHDYISIAEKIEPILDKKMQEKIVRFINNIKNDESTFLITINPRLVVGIKNLCRARARMFLREHVTESDVEEVLGIFRKSLYDAY